MKSSKIIIPEPCNKGWDNMTPNNNGRHCDTCDKVVVDFTQMNKEEIKSYFIQKSGSKICGHFRISQVEPNRPKLHRKLIGLYNSIEQKISLRVFKRVSLAGVALCMFLVGCQNKPEVEGKIEKRSCDKNEQRLTGDTIIPQEQTVDGGICPAPDETIEGKMEIEEPTVDGDMMIDNEVK